MKKRLFEFENAKDGLCGTKNIVSFPMVLLLGGEREGEGEREERDIVAAWIKSQGEANSIQATLTLSIHKRSLRARRRRRRRDYIVKQAKGGHNHCLCSNAAVEMLAAAVF